METKLLNMDGTEEGRQNLPESVFSKKPNAHFLHEIVKYYMSSRRRGTACVKTKAEVRGGGKKPWKQKHTGRARHGTIRSPLWRKGGVVFGPKPRSWAESIPSAKRRKALCQALSLKFSENAVCAVKELKTGEAKSRSVKGFLKSAGFSSRDRILFVDEKMDKNFAVSVRNFPNIAWSDAANLNAYDILRAERICLTPGAVEVLSRLLKPRKTPIFNGE